MTGRLAEIEAREMMPDYLVELRFVVSVEDDIHPEIVADDFLADLRSHWVIAEVGARVVPAEKEE